MKIARTQTSIFDCLVVMTDELPSRKEKEDIESKLIAKHGQIIIYFISSKPEEADLWITNKFGVEKEHHDTFKEIDFDFVLFKDPSYFL